jgi:drug/metabolite transporter (DMT)-like permease
VAVFLGVLVALAFGSGDFVGGRASMRVSTAAVLVVSQACAVTAAVVLALVVGARVAPHDVWFGVAAGAANVVGLGLLYRGLATAAMGVVAPVTAVVAAVVPLTWGLTHGERPSAVVLAGLVLAISAAGVLAVEPDATKGRLAPGFLTAIGAGGTLGGSLVLFAQTSSASGMWPVFAARAAAFVLAAAAFVWFARRRAVRLPTGSTRGLAVAAGFLDVAATALIVLAVRRGLLAVVAGLAALAPGFTVVLAWVVLHQRLARYQRAGLALALVGLVLVAAG